MPKMGDIKYHMNRDEWSLYNINVFNIINYGVL